MDGISMKLEEDEEEKIGDPTPCFKFYFIMKNYCNTFLCYAKSNLKLANHFEIDGLFSERRKLPQDNQDRVMDVRVIQ
jgi:hypothetical protein